MKWDHVIPVLKNKYFIASLVFIVWIVFFDDNNLLERSQLINELQQLRDDKVYYTHQIKEDSKRLEELKTNKDNLEKFAREQYFMKKPDEEVYVIVDE
jgi:cell division protein FtsB